MKTAKKIKTRKDTTYTQPGTSWRANAHICGQLPWPISSQQLNTVCQYGWVAYIQKSLVCNWTLLCKLVRVLKSSFPSLCTISLKRSSNNTRIQPRDNEPDLPSMKISNLPPLMSPWEQEPFLVGSQSSQNLRTITKEWVAEAVGKIGESRIEAFLQILQTTHHASPCHEIYGSQWTVSELHMGTAITYHANRKWRVIWSVNVEKTSKPRN